MKIFGFGLVVPIFDVTREKLLTLPWFAYLYEKLLVFHEFAQRLVAPYREDGDRLCSSPARPRARLLVAPPRRRGGRGQLTARVAPAAGSAL